jgi:hypothetical protein
MNGFNFGDVRLTKVLLTPCNIAQVESMQGVAFLGAQSLGSCTSDNALSGECAVDLDLEHEQLMRSENGRDLLVRLSKTRCAPKYAQRSTAQHSTSSSERVLTSDHPTAYCPLRV